MPLWQISPVFLSGTALTAQVPNNAISGGNARGTNAVDLSTTRNAASQVASGLGAVIGGGAANTSSGIRSTVAGGETCAATANNASIGGGINNTASGGAATVAGGNTNVASGTSAAVAGGQNNIASGITSTVAGGRTNTASGIDSAIGGGNSNTVSGISSWVPGGTLATTRGITGRGAWSGGQIAALGDAQAGEHMLRRQTTDATQTRLTADNAAAGTSNQITLPNFSSYGGILKVTAKAAGSTDAAIWIVNCGAVRGNGVGTVVALGGGASIAPTLSNGTGSNWRLAITADTTIGALAVDATGAAATTINWSARYSNVEVVTAS